MWQRVREFIGQNHFLHNQINFFLVILLIILNLLVWLLWIFKIQPLGYPIYLATELPFNSLRCYTLPILGSIFSLINGWLAYHSSRKEVLIGFYLLSAGVLIEILILALIRHYLLTIG
jgi:hypothetical protein